ncbi:ATP-binding protein [Pirellulaceae bacterium SH501]
MNNRYSCIRSKSGFISPEQSHTKLFLSQSVLALGRLQWFLEHGDAAIHDEVWEKGSEEDFDRHGIRVKDRIRTAFGRELNGDPIYWWVQIFTEDLENLRSRTVEALEAAEVLKETTKKLKNQEKQYEDYTQMLTELQNVAEAVATHVETLVDYAEWLHIQDRKGPGILFTYRVWGSTRRSERHLDLQCDSLNEEPEESIQVLALAVVGLWSNKLLTIDRELFYKADEFYLSTQGESDRAFYVDEARLIRKVAIHALDQFAEYAVFVRDSLRNILLEIDKCSSIRATLLSDQFLREFIEIARNSLKRETEYWDFKQSLEMWHAKGQAREDAKVSLCEQIAAFANAKGGILIIGVTDDRRIVGFSPGKDLENKIASLGKAIADQIQYPRSFAEIVEIPLALKNGPTICIAVVVRECSSVIAVRKDNSYTYPVRSGSGKIFRSHDEIETSKLSVKHDNFDELTRVVTQFVRDSKNGRQE